MLLYKYRLIPEGVNMELPIVTKKRRKYGANCFKNWGKKGGSPILKAYAQHRITIKR